MTYGILFNVQGHENKAHWGRDLAVGSCI